MRLDGLYFRWTGRDDTYTCLGEWDGTGRHINDKGARSSETVLSCYCCWLVVGCSRGCDACCAVGYVVSVVSGA